MKIEEVAGKFIPVKVKKADRTKDLYVPHRKTCTNWPKKPGHTLIDDNTKFSPHQYLTLAEAAAVLHMTTAALRQRCMRKVDSVGSGKSKQISARIGDGVVGVKFGRNWRFRAVRPVS
ncbi:MAG: hypothetical protein FWD57_02860 [Polyangiaceae bacterium]|nr:hypothetical protein [Polyangiaceae bacterium]